MNTKIEMLEAIETDIVEAISTAMEDFLENSGFTPHTPGIIIDHDRVYYGSTDAVDEETFVSFDEQGFFAWHPESVDDIPACARGFFADIRETKEREAEEVEVRFEQMAALGFEQ